MAYKGFQYTKDIDTYTDTGVNIYWRYENRKCKQFFFFCKNQFSTKFQLNFDVIRRIFLPIVVVDQTSFRRNGFRPNVMDPYFSYLFKIPQSGSGGGVV